MDYRREAGSSKRLRRAIKRGDKQRATKQQKLVLWHYSSPDHRSVRRYPILNSKNPSWCQNDQQHIRAHFKSILLEPRHSRTFTDAFLVGSQGARSTNEQTTVGNRPTHAPRPPRPWNKLQIAFRNSTWSPE
ncbi:hypothetical protein CDL15_Pgr012288 [Punica granatum]|uniref:Uncharacterized protein n=1 Tax=Punica granatum TaxID=22663 RepID=A0A218WS72_PUNGR|nr:hypothetical protein CDL15_Pgr012288 [Punica granatum]